MLTKIQSIKSYPKIVTGLQIIHLKILIGYFTEDPLSSWKLFQKGLQPIYLSHKSDYKSIDIFEGKFKHRKIISSSKDLDLLIKKEIIGKLTNDKELIHF